MFCVCLNIFVKPGRGKYHVCFSVCQRVRISGHSQLESTPAHSTNDS